MSASIRKIKRRAMARMAEPLVTLKFDGPTLDVLRRMKTIERQNFIRQAIRRAIAARFHWN